MMKGNTEVTKLGSLFGFICPDTTQFWVQNRGESSNFSTDTAYTVKILVIRKKLNIK